MKENDSSPEKGKKRKKKKSNNYFNQDTEDAIVEFQNAKGDLAEQEHIFVEKIRPSFLKLIENIIFVYKFHTLGDIDTLKNDCLAFLFENLYKFDATRGHKAFSYYNICSKNWFIQRVKVFKKKNKLDVHLDQTVLSKLEKNENEMVVSSFEDEFLKQEYFELLKEEMKTWRNKFTKPQEKIVLESVILLMSNPDFISIFSKKGIFLYLREISGLSTKQIVTNLSKLRKKYESFKKRYHIGEF